MGALEVSIMRLSIVTTLSFLFLGCGSNSFDKSTDHNPQEGGSPVPTVEGGAPPGCDITKQTKDEPCLITEGVGVFVSSSFGSAQGDGSRAKPLASIQAGIELARTTKKRVYVCAETFAEA